jgi:mannitol/fructose-specific phosphotransferase system IIA component
MTIGELIGANHVIVGLRVASKTQLLQELARRVGAALSLDQRMILDALQTRENLGATGLGKGFALPHARLGVLQRSFVLFVRLSRPIDFGSIDGLPVDLVILLLTRRMLTISIWQCWLHCHDHCALRHLCSVCGRHQMQQRFITCWPGRTCSLG